MSYHPRHIVGPAGSSDEAPVRFDGVTGNLAQNTNDVIFSDDGYVGLGIAPNEWLTVGGPIAFEEVPGSPSDVAGFGKLFVRSSTSSLIFRNDSGTEVDLTVVSPVGGSGTDGYLSYWSSGSTLAADTAGVLYWDDTTHRFGIGTDSPDWRLHVSDNVNAGLAIAAENTNTGSGASSLVIAKGSTATEYVSMGYYPAASSTTQWQDRGVIYVDSGTAGLVLGSQPADMRFQIGPSSTVPQVQWTSTELAFNENGDDLDFRVEGSGDANLLFVDAGNNRIGLGTNAPSVLLDAITSTATGVMISLERSGASGSSSGGSLRLYQNDSTTMVADERLGVVTFQGFDGTANAAGADIAAFSESTWGTGDTPGYLVFLTTADGSGATVERARITSSGVLRITSDGAEATPTLTFGSTTDDDTGFWHPAANTLAVSVGAAEVMRFGTTEVVVNGDGDDRDFRVEGNTETNLVFADAGNDRVGIGISTPATRFEVQEDQNSVTAARVTNLNTGDSPEAQFQLETDGGVLGFVSAAGASHATTLFSTSAIGIADAFELRSGSSASGGLLINTRTTAPVVLGTNSTAQTESITIESGGGVVVNDGSSDYDFRVESNSDANMLFVNSGEDRVQIRTNADFTETDSDFAVNGVTAFAEVVTPGTPDAGWGFLYAEADGYVYWKNDDGITFNLTQGTGGGGGGGTITGSGVDGYVTYWTGATSISADTSNLFYWDNVTGSLGIGTASPAANLGIIGSMDVNSSFMINSDSKIDHDVTYTTVFNTAEDRLYEVNARVSSGGSGTNSFPRALFAELHTEGATAWGVSSSVTALQGQVKVESTTTVPEAIGLFGRVWSNTGVTATVSRAIGLSGEIASSSGSTITTTEGIAVLSSINETATLSGTDFYFFKGEISGTPSYTTAYGLHLPDITFGSTNYGVYSEGGLNYFASDVGIGTVPSVMLEVLDTAASGVIASLERSGASGSNSGGHLRLYQNDGTTMLVDERLGLLSFQGYNGTSNSVGAGVQGFASATWSSGDTPGYLVFTTTPDGSSSQVERARITDEGAFWLNEIAAPVTPNAGFGALYFKSDGYVYAKNDSGEEFNLASGGGGGGAGLSGGEDGYVTYWTSANTVSADTINVFYWDDINGRLGIGTDTPSVDVDVQNNVNGAVRSEITNLSTGVNAFASHRSSGNTANVFIESRGFGSGNTNTTFGISNADAVSLFSGTASARMIISSLGTTAPIEMGTASNTNSNRSLILGANGGPVVINEDSADMDFRVEGNGNANLLFTDAGNDRVGIGTNAPAQDLHVLGVTRLERETADTSVTRDAIQLVHDTSGNMVDGLGIGFSFWIEDSAAGPNRIASINGIRDGADDSGALTFGTYSSGTEAEAMRIDDAGNVGIGTSSPVTPLHVSLTDSAISSSLHGTWISVFSHQATNGVYGAVVASNTANHQPYFLGVRARGTLASPTTVADDDSLLIIQAAGYDGTNRHGTASVKFEVDGTVSSNVLPARIVFETSATTNAALVDRMTITSAGDVGIGTGVPDVLLHVSDAAASLFQVTNTSTSGSSAGAGIIAESDDGAAMADGDRLGFYLFRGQTSGAGGNNSAGVVGYAEGAWSGTSAPSRLSFETTATNSTSRVERFSINQGEVVVNDTATTWDFRVEGSADTHLLFADAGTNSIAIGTSSPVTGAILTVDGDIVPAVDQSYEFGKDNLRWADGYIDNIWLDFNGTPVAVDGYIIKDQMSGHIETAANKTYYVVSYMNYRGTITDVVTQSASGTATGTVNINAVSLGGTANSISSSEQIQSHTTSNTFIEGDEITFVITSNSSALDVRYSILINRTAV